MLVLSLLACGDPPAAPGNASTPANPPAAAPTPSTGLTETRVFALDTPVGPGGAPDGVTFTPDEGTAFTAGALSDGSVGFRFTATAPGDAVACTQPVKLGPTATARARFRVLEIEPGPQGWMGLNVEVRAWDAAGNLASPPGKRYVVLRDERVALGWLDPVMPVKVPEGATSGQVCFRLVGSTGTVEVDRVAIGPSADAVATAPPPPSSPPLPSPAPPTAAAPPTPSPTDR